MKKTNLRRLLKVGVVAFVPFLGACEWFSNFEDTAMLTTWEPIHCNELLKECDITVPSRGNPQMSVPIYGNMVSGLEASYAGMPGVIESMSGLENPTPVTAASLHNGRKYYEINCAVCHGEKGSGDGKATRYGLPGITIIAGPALERTDGYIFGVIRNGRGAMPSYNRIEEMDRWDVVNYVRALQGQTEITTETGQLAMPGVTGRWIPGATATAPTRPAPFQPPHQGSARHYYRAGEAPPETDPHAVRVGAPKIDSMLYKSGTITAKKK